jgi:hypothetical protein
LQAQVWKKRFWGSGINDIFLHHPRWGLLL